MKAKKCKKQLKVKMNENNRNMKSLKRKVLVIGLDGVGFDFIKDWLEQGKLPTIAKLMERGVYGDLQSTIPPITPPAWASFMTGMNPGKHGIYDFVTVKRKKSGDDEYNLVDSKNIKGKCIWDFLTVRNKKSIVLNVPLTYPPWEINGIMISGHPSPSTKNYAYPKDVLKELEKNIGEYIIFPDENILNHPEKNFKGLLKIIEKRKEAAIYLMKNYEYDFFMVEFQMTDTICHLLKDRGKILEIYQKVDGSIAEILEHTDAQRTNVIIISDHGMGTVKKAIRINKWLQELGLYKTKEGLQKEFISPATIMKSGHHIKKSRKGILFNLLSSIGITVEKINYYLSILRMDFLKKLVPKSIIYSLPRITTDWCNTKAYLSQRNYGTGISINLKGREKEGIVEPGEEYEKLRNYIIRELYNLRDPETGEKVIEKALKREEVYSGPYLNNAPDILVLTKDQEYISDSSPYGDIFSRNTNEIHTHKMNGIFIAYGPDIKRGQIKGARIIDIAPTILHMMDIPVPEDMDGRVLKEIFKEDSDIARRKVIYQKMDEKERIKERIGKLNFNYFLFNINILIISMSSLVKVFKNNNAIRYMTKAIKLNNNMLKSFK